MAVEEIVRQRIMQLIEQSECLSVGTEHGQCVDDRQRQECVAYITAAQNAVRRSWSEKQHEQQFGDVQAAGQKDPGLRLHVEAPYW